MGRELRRWTNERDDRPSRVVLREQEDGSVLVGVQTVHQEAVSAPVTLEDRWAVARFFAAIDEE